MLDDHRGLRVTQIDVLTVDDPTHSNLKAHVVVTLNGAIRIKNVNVIQAKDGRTFASFPTKALKSGILMDLVHPVDEPTRRWIETLILEAYIEAYRRELTYAADWEAATAPRSELKEAI